MNFGAFVEIAPGKDGLVHISELAEHRVPSVEDEVSIGDEVEVMVIEVDSQGRINLSRRAVLAGETDPAAVVARQAAERGSRGGGGGDRGGDRGGDAAAAAAAVGGGYRGGGGDRGPRNGGGGAPRQGGGGFDRRGPAARAATPARAAAQMAVFERTSRPALPGPRALPSASNSPGIILQGPGRRESGAPSSRVECSLRNVRRGLPCQVAPRLSHGTKGRASSFRLGGHGRHHPTGGSAAWLHSQ